MTIGNAINTQLSGETGTGQIVGDTAPSISSALLTTPALGTPSSGTLTSCSGLPIAGISGLGANVDTWLATPSSANLASALTDETGTGAAVFATSPDLVTPVVTGITDGSTAAAGEVGEILSATVVAGAAVSLVTTTTKTVTSLALTAGVWEVHGLIAMNIGIGGATELQASISNVDNTAPTADQILDLDTSISQIKNTSYSSSITNKVLVGPAYHNLSGSQTVYLVARIIFPSGTCTAHGKIWARRVR